MSPTPPLLDDMVVFAEVVDAGGITAAAARLGLRKSTVSRRLAALEERLGTRLLERNTRRLRLTESGREYHAHCARLVAEARAVNQALSESRNTPRGTLCLVTFSLLGELLTPVISEFSCATRRCAWRCRSPRPMWTSSPRSTTWPCAPVESAFQQVL